MAAGSDDIGRIRALMDGMIAAEVPRETAPPQEELPPVAAYEDEPAARPHVDQYAIDERAAIAAEGAVSSQERRKTSPAPQGTVQPARPAPIDWEALEALEPPPREWIVPFWVPAGHLTLLAGAGGVGKTLLAQHIGTALALGSKYLEELKPKRVLMWAAEDDEAELWRRQVPISRYFGSPMSALKERFCLRSYIGQDVTLMAPIYSALLPTPMLTELREQTHDLKAEIVILDNIARLFGGSENDRHQVTTFCSLVQGACAPAAVILLGHPSKQLGSEYSGSTAWEGAVRARLYLGNRPPDQGSEELAEPPEDGVRYLCRRKANYSALDLRKFTLSGEGVLTPELLELGPPRAVGGEFAKDAVRRAIRRLAERDIYGTPSTASPTYLPKLAAQYKMLDGTSTKSFGEAMRQLILAGEIKSAPVGLYSNRTPKLGLTLVK